MQGSSLQDEDQDRVAKADKLPAALLLVYQSLEKHHASLLRRAIDERQAQVLDTACTPQNTQALIHGTAINGDCRNKGSLSNSRTELRPL